jgi:molybdate transport system ATP-binding protein
MTRLTGRFVRRFSAGPRIEGEIDLPVGEFSVLVLFGPSGSGKTTVLRCLAGLDTPQEGTIRWEDEIWCDATRGVSLAPQRRAIGYLFQQHALFPHRTVWQNVCYGVARKGTDDEERLRGLLERLGLSGLEQRYPKQLSGGQQQRVALARTLACRPRLLLLDEPLSTLDQGLREEVRSQLRNWLTEFALPTVLVTHDRIDAMALGDRIAVMSEGRIVQQGSIEEVFSRPFNDVVARIVGVESVVEGRLMECVDGLACFDVQGTRVWAPAGPMATGRALLCIRGEDVAFMRTQEGTSSIRNRLRGVVTSLTSEGPLVRLGIDCGFPLTALITKPACAELGLRVGEVGVAMIKATAIHVIWH